MHPSIYIERRDVVEAEKLIAAFGAAAADEAAERASHSRNLGNHINFCRWRQIERLIDVLASDAIVGRLH